MTPSDPSSSADKSTSSTKQFARETLHTLESDYPSASTELTFDSPYELLVATILSAQSTDKRVNDVTPKLFKQFPDARALSVARPSDIQTLIRSTGCFRIKARSLILMATTLVKKHRGHVPTSIQSLTALPGVGRKTANVILGHAFNMPGFAVDRHVIRVANRIGLIQTKDPTTAEFALKELFPESMWTYASDVLIQHGRKICRTRPSCDNCSVQPQCKYQIQTPH